MAKTKAKIDVYEIVTNRIIEQLEAGCVPWHKPWATGGGYPKNLKSGKAYRGINVFSLGMAGYASAYWVTFKQAKELGGSVIKGEKSTPIVFWKFGDKENKTTGEKESYAVVRYYNVFNTDQCEGLEVPGADAEPLDFNPIEEAEKIVDGMPYLPEIKFGEAQAYYSPTFDFVNMPKPESFEGEAEYYSVLLHELVHATGHPKRLDRSTMNKKAAFGSHEYSKEELVAEMGSAFLCAEAGIIDRTINNSAAYIENWLKKLKSDRKFLVQAAAAAQKAADYIMVRKFETADQKAVK